MTLIFILIFPKECFVHNNVCFFFVLHIASSKRLVWLCLCCWTVPLRSSESKISFRSNNLPGRTKISPLTTPSPCCRMLPSWKEDQRRKKSLTTTPLFTHTHTKGETTWLLDGGQIGGGSLAGGIRSTWDAEMKDSLPITHDPARSSAFVRPHAPFEWAFAMLLIVTTVQ